MRLRIARAPAAVAAARAAFDARLGSVALLVIERVVSQ
jgi:hypothetical protein